MRHDFFSKLTLILSVGCFLVFQQEQLSFCADSENAPSPETLTLAKAIDKAIENNIGFKTQKMQYRSAEISFDNAWETMFTPGISLSISANSKLTAGDLKDHVGIAAEKAHGYPSQSATLSLGSYTLFNFWKDWNRYEQARLDWVRAQEIYMETLRAFKFEVSRAYFESKIAQDNFESAKRFFSLAETILHLMKSRRKVNKASDSDITSAEQDFLAARIEFGNTTTSTNAANWKLNQIFNDPQGKSYLLVDDPEFEPIQVDIEEIIEIYRTNSPTVKNIKKDLRKSELSLDSAEKDRLPLPQVKFSGLTLSYGNEFNGLTREYYTDGSGNTQLNVSASVSLSLPIWGSGGFLSSRNMELARMSVEQQRLGIKDTISRDEVRIRELVRSIAQTEQNIRDYKKSLTGSSTQLDQLINRGSQQGGMRLDFRDLLRQMRTDQTSLADANLSHVTSKYELYQLIGVDKLENKK